MLQDVDTIPSPILPKKKMGGWLKKIGQLLLLGFVIIQFFQPDKNNNTPISKHNISSILQVPDSVHLILKKNCYNCHSNHTNYPWYSNIQPIGWIISSHIKEGKTYLNFDEFAQYNKSTQSEILKQIAIEIQDGQMPLFSYKLLHTQATLSEKEKNAIVNWVKNERENLGQNKSN